MAMLDREEYEAARREFSSVAGAVVEESTHDGDSGPYHYLMVTLREEAPVRIRELAAVAVATRGYLTMHVHGDSVAMSVAVSRLLTAEEHAEALSPGS